MIFALIIVLIFSGNISAQDSVYTLPPIEVTAGRTPRNSFQSYEIIQADVIQLGIRGVSLLESLQPGPGIIINDRNNPSMGDKISIRGIGSRASFGIRGVKILMDNIPLTLPDGQSQTNNIDLLSTGKIEILKGPASSFYGNASGGVINFTSENPSSKIISVSPMVILGEYNLKKYSLKLSGTAGSHSYLMNLGHTDYRGFREHSAQKTFQINSLYRYNLNKKININAVINYFNAPYLQNPGSLVKPSSELNRASARDYIKIQGAGEQADQLQAGVTMNLSDEDFTLETTFYFLTRDLLNPIPGRIIDLDRNAGGFRSSAKTNLSTSDFLINIAGGFDIEFQRDIRKEFMNNGLPDAEIPPEDVFSSLQYGDKLIDQKEQVSSAAPYISTEIFLNNQFGILGVIRYDNYLFKVSDYFAGNSGSQKMTQWSPAAGILYKPDTFLKIFFNYSTSFQTPTTAELSNREDGQSGFNTGLNPERIYQLEFGTDYYSDMLLTRFSFAAYSINFSNMLIPYQSVASEEIFYRNAGRALNDGIEIKGETTLNKNLSWSLAYTRMDFTFRDYLVNHNNTYYQLSGNYIPAIPKNILSFNMNFSLDTGLWFRGALNWNDSYFTNDFNAPPPGSTSPAENFINDSYLNININIGYNFIYTLFEGSFFIGVNNILDELYNGSVVSNAAGERYYEPAPGRNFYFGARLIFE